MDKKDLAIEYLITAVKNLCRRNKFLETYQLLSNGDITEEEFEEEIKDYVVYISEQGKSGYDFDILIDLVMKITDDPALAKELSVWDFATMFSVSGFDFMDLAVKLRMKKDGTVSRGDNS